MRPILLAPAAALLLAAAPSRAAEIKLGFVDFQKALNEVEEGKVATANLRSMAAEKQKVLEGDQAELRRLDGEYQKQQAVLSDEARRDKERELQQRALEAQNRFMGFQKEMMEKERELTSGIRLKMAKIAEEIATAEGLTLMFERSEAGIIYGPEKLDFTTQLIRLYDQRHKPEAAAAAKKKADKKDDKKAKDDKKGK
jgi:outer membrane protein